MKVAISNPSGFPTKYLPMLERAAVLADKVLKTEEFKQIVTNTGEQKLIAALLGPEPLALNVRFYRPWNPFTSAVAYAQNGVLYLNPKSFNRGLPELAGTLIHEFTHTLGYTHSFFQTPDRDNSIPYLIGNAVADIAKKVQYE